MVHPAKFHFHKPQINNLKSKGCHVDIVINTKDILEELVQNEGWEYTNLFPNSRKIKGIHVYLAAFISLLSTIYRLYKYTSGKKYDIFVGDALVYIGRLKGIPSFYPTDDVLEAVPEQRVFFIPAKHIIAPIITDIGKYKSKKIAYRGYKAIAHLHPNHFKPNRNKLLNDFQSCRRYFIIRCTGFGATHDINKRGIDDVMLDKIIKLLAPHGKILISSERRLPKEFEKFQFQINKNDINHYISFSDLFIGDSTTMCTESAVLGIPTVEFDEYFFEIEQMTELEKKYGLINCFRTTEAKQCLQKIEEHIHNPNSKIESKQKATKLFEEMIDVSSFLTWMFENYPESYKKFSKDNSIQNYFK